MGRARRRRTALFCEAQHCSKGTIRQHPMPDDREIGKIELSPMSSMGVEDGNYTLRYSFNGKPERRPRHRVQNGVLLAAGNMFRRDLPNNPLQAFPCSVPKNVVNFSRQYNEKIRHLAGRRFRVSKNVFFLDVTLRYQSRGPQTIGLGADGLDNH